MITKKKLENFLDKPVKLVNFEDNTFYGWFVKRDNVYLVLPFDWSNQSIYGFRASHIKSIKHLTNEYEIRR